MANVIKLRKGLDINLKGKAAEEFMSVKEPGFYSLVPDDFTGTYNSGGAVSHVGIYCGNGVMIHAGDPIKYSNINTSYWQSHFYAFGRLN